MLRYSLITDRSDPDVTAFYSFIIRITSYIENKERKMKKKGNACS